MTGDNWPSAEASEWAVLHPVTGLLPNSKELEATELYLFVLTHVVKSPDFMKPEIRICM